MLNYLMLVVLQAEQNLMECMLGGENLIEQCKEEYCVIIDVDIISDESSIYIIK